MMCQCHVIKTSVESPVSNGGYSVNIQLAGEKLGGRLTEQSIC